MPTCRRLNVLLAAWLAPILTHPCSTCGTTPHQVRPKLLPAVQLVPLQGRGATPGGSKAAIRADTIAATFSPSDTVYLFSVDGTNLASIPSRPATSGKPILFPTQPEADLQRRREWLSTFDLVAAVSWADTAGFSCLSSFVNGRPIWKLLGVRRTGRLWFDDPTRPDCHADSLGQELVFVEQGRKYPIVGASQVSPSELTWTVHANAWSRVFDCRTRRRVLAGRSRPRFRERRPLRPCGARDCGFVTTSGNDIRGLGGRCESCLQCRTPDYVLRRLVVVSTQLQVLHFGDRPDRVWCVLSRERRLPMLAATMSVTGARRAFWSARHTVSGGHARRHDSMDRCSRGPQPRSRESCGSTRLGK